jgi:hypothetical protein
MKQIILCIGFIIINMHSHAFTVPEENKFNYIADTDTLPKVLAKDHADLIESKLRNEAVFRFAEHQLPATKKEWEKSRVRIRNEVIKKAGIVIDHKLPLNYTETGSIKMEGFTIRKIAFQTRQGVYATANLYVPDGNGPFPAVINMHGHWREGRMSDAVQSVAHTLVLNGYVCLSIDAFGAGERSTVHGVYEYHGNNLGASTMNIGESLMGIQVSDNMRGVDLLSSLSYVDPQKIGATGASGGGNQTMWLTAIDERIKASMPVVSVGTFESYVMNDNCICELPIDALTFTEEAGIIALVAPRAIKICAHKKDDIPAFSPEQMIRTYNNARPVFKMLGAENNISYQLFDTTHGYWQADREGLLGWFNLHLKEIGNGTPVKEIQFTILKDEQLMVYPKGKRDPKVENISEYCKRVGKGLRNNLLSARTFNTGLKKQELRNILRLNEESSINKVYQYSDINGWNRFALETNDNKLIPLLHLAPRNKSLGYVILSNPKGKDGISTAVIGEFKKKGSGLVIVDLSGTGEASSITDDSLDFKIKLHTLSRADLLLGKTILGEWVNELDVVTKFLKSRYNAQKISIDGTRETGLAALFFSCVNESSYNVILREAPLSYLFDNRETVDFYSMGIHLPGFLKWGDVSLAAALTGKNILFITPLTMSGGKLSETQLKEYETEFARLRRICKQPGKAVFN